MLTANTNGSGSPPAKRAKCREYDIHLEGAVTEEPHPLLSSRTKEKQQSGNKKGNLKRFGKQ